MYISVAIKKKEQKKQKKPQNQQLRFHNFTFIVKF